MVEQGSKRVLGWRYAIAIGSGAMLSISFFLERFWWCSLFALSPTLALICLRERNGKSAALLIWLCAFVAHSLINAPLVPTIVNLRSIVHLSLPAAISLSLLGLLLLALMQSIFFLPVGAIAHLLFRKLGYAFFAVGCASAWTVAEWVRSLGIMGSQWGCIAYALLPCTVILQPAEYIGTYGLCFLMVLLNGALAVLLCSVLRAERRCALNSGLLVAILILAWLFLGWRLIDLEIRRWSDGWHSLTIAAIQGNLSWRDKQSAEGVELTLKLHTSMTMSASKHRPKLIVWAETAIPIALNRQNSLKAAIGELSIGSNSDMLIGAIEEEEQSGRVFNACYGVRAGGEFVGTYRKVKLVPFGEFVPMRKRIKLLERIAAHEADFSHGDRVEPLHLRNASAAIAICFDSLFPWVIRLQVKRGANLLVIITNDEWFWGNWMARHHADVAKLRAIESRLYLVRAANSGISCIVDPMGRVIAELPLRRRGTLLGAVGIPSEHQMTAYVRFGDIAVLLALALLMAAAVLARTCRGGQYSPQALR